MQKPTEKASPYCRDSNHTSNPEQKNRLKERTQKTIINSRYKQYDPAFQESREDVQSVSQEHKFVPLSRASESVESPEILKSSMSPKNPGQRLAERESKLQDEHRKRCAEQFEEQLRRVTAPYSCSPKSVHHGELSPSFCAGYIQGSRKSPEKYLSRVEESRMNSKPRPGVLQKYVKDKTQSKAFASSELVQLIEIPHFEAKTVGSDKCKERPTEAELGGERPTDIELQRDAEHQSIASRERAPCIIACDTLIAMSCQNFDEKEQCIKDLNQNLGNFDHPKIDQTAGIQSFEGSEAKQKPASAASDACWTSYRAASIPICWPRTAKVPAIRPVFAAPEDLLPGHSAQSPIRGHIESSQVERQSLVSIADLSAEPGTCGMTVTVTPVHGEEPSPSGPGWESEREFENKEAAGASAQDRCCNVNSQDCDPKGEDALRTVQLVPSQANTTADLVFVSAAAPFTVRGFGFSLLPLQDVRGKPELFVWRGFLVLCLMVAYIYLFSFAKYWARGASATSRTTKQPSHLDAKKNSFVEELCQFSTLPPSSKTVTTPDMLKDISTQPAARSVVKSGVGLAPWRKNLEQLLLLSPLGSGLHFAAES